MHLTTLIDLGANALSRSQAARRRGLQNSSLRASGLAWRADPCPDPGSCETHLCVADDEGRHWHPADPLAFAKWRVRAIPDAIPSHLRVRTGGWAGARGWTPPRRPALLVGAVGLGSAAVGAAVWLALHSARERSASS
jgi:hypothetical protein